MKELDLHWVNASSVHANSSLTMKLQVTDGGIAVEGARLTLRFARPDAPALLHAGIATDSGAMPK